MEEEPKQIDRRQIVYLAVFFEGGLIVLSWLLGWALDRRPLDTFHWTWEGAGIGVATTIPMMLIFFALIRWPIGPFARIKKLTDEFIRPLMSSCTTLDLFGIAVLAGLGEEMLFRAVIQGELTQWLNSPWLGLGLASILFGVGHALTLTYAIFATVMGAYLGWIWQLTDNLFTVALAHALYDFLALVIIIRVIPPRESAA